jgi:predicted Zn-dependent protease
LAATTEGASLAGWVDEDDDADEDEVDTDDEEAEAEAEAEADAAVVRFDPESCCRLAARTAASPKSKTLPATEGVDAEDESRRTRASAETCPDDDDEEDDEEEEAVVLVVRLTMSMSA